MKYFLFISAIILSLSFPAAAQKAKPKAGPLPAAIRAWAGQDSDKLLKDPVITTRLKTLMGKTNYASFIESFETLAPITKDGDVLFASGCLIHACTHLESAIAINLKANTIHAAIYNDVTEFKTTEEFRDDIAFVVTRFH